MKRLGYAEPAMHQTTSGARPSFDDMASAMTRADDSCSDRSALIYWKRWAEGFAAKAWESVSSRSRAAGRMSLP